MTIIVASFALSGFAGLTVVVLYLAGRLRQTERRFADFRQTAGSAILELQFARLPPPRDSSITGRHSRPMAVVEPGPS